MILKDNYDKAIKIMDQIGGKDDALTMTAYLEWPLFKEIRKTEQFTKAINKIFGTSDYNLKQPTMKQTQEVKKSPKRTCDHKIGAKK